MRPSEFIDPYRPAETAPPGTLVAFIRWCLAGSWGVLGAAALFSFVAGLTETGTAWVLGRVVDAVVARGPDAFFSSANLGVFTLALVFFLVIRPAAFGLSNYATSVVVAPSLAPMVMARLYRWMLVQSVGFFDDDFAGRLAQKQAQTARATTSMVVETINVVAFALASLAGTFLLITTIDPGLSIAFAAWLVVYFGVIRWFMPRVRTRSKARAGARAQVTGQVVDTITNIRTVKLFAHADREDASALDAIETFRAASLDFGHLSAGFRLTLMVLAGILPLMLTGGALMAWSRGETSEGAIVAAGVVAIRIAQMTGWVSFALMGLYSDIGEVEDGMRTLSPDRRLPDAPDAVPLVTSGGAIRFEGVSFSYGRSENEGELPISADGRNIGRCLEVSWPLRSPPTAWGAHGTPEWLPLGFGEDRNVPGVDGGLDVSSPVFSRGEPKREAVPASIPYVGRTTRRYGCIMGSGGNARSPTFMTAVFQKSVAEPPDVTREAMPDVVWGIYNGSLAVVFL